MKQFIRVFIIIAFSALLLNVFGQSNNYPFEVKISGMGKQAILLIPGYACSGDVWNDTKALYEKQFTCYTLTMAGFAGVPAQKGASFENWEKAIAQYIKDKKINKPLIIGHSMGGGLALALAADYPELIDKIVVVDALPCLAATRDSTFKVSADKDYSGMVAKFTSWKDDEYYKMQKQTIPYLMADTAHLETVVQWSVKSDRATLAQMFSDFMNTDLRDKIATIKCPALILLETGFADIKPVIDKQYSKLKTAHITYSTKGLHFIMYDDKEWYLKQLTAFVN
jgi:pimeloyl-ACP methyl ester carboxylesterase